MFQGVLVIEIPSACFSRFKPGLKHVSSFERMKAEAATAKKLVITAMVSVAFGRLLFPLMVLLIVVLPGPTPATREQRD